MSAGKLSMNADFFHPTWDGGRNRRDVVAPVESTHSRGEDWDYFNNPGWRTGAAGFDNDTSTASMRPEAAAAFGEAIAAERREADDDDIGETIAVDPRDDDGTAADRNPLMDNGNYRAAVRAFVTWTLANANNGNADRDGGGRRNSLPNNPRGGRLHGLLGNPSAWSGLNGSSNSAASASSPAADVHLEVYSSATANPKPENDEDRAVAEALSKMRVRAKLYQTRLDSLLKSNAANNSSSGAVNKFDTSSFQECLLDYWDELFPTTAGIHFYNQQSPVPRMTHLHSFLTTPCPKAVGTIQCEIERVKVSRKSKGAKGVTKGMKGKFFPSYEYRLFVRDTKNDNPFHSGRAPPRKDTVLLVAKNKNGGKGKNAFSSNNGGNYGGGGSGVGGLDFASAASPASAATKRGVTNYYMCLPNQSNVDGHYRSANRSNPNAVLNPGARSGLAVSPMAAAADAAAAAGGGKKNGGGAVEVGRLQSNFIGTEFQIFVPNKSLLNSRNSEERQQREANDMASEEGGDPRVHPIDTAVVPAATAIANTPTSNRRQSRRGSGLVRMARRASSTLSRRGSSNALNRETGGQPSEDSGENVGSSQRRGSFGSKKTMRRMTWGSTGNANISSRRTSRRAIANNYDSFDADLHASHHSGRDLNAAMNMGEVENGAITYTANLLGNRPRIMDVCIPKLLEDGRVWDEWSGEQRESVATSVINGGSNGGTASNMLDRFKTIQQGLENSEETVAPNNNNNDGNDTNDNVGINDENTNTDNHGLMILQNRPPWWNIELGAFVLNFGGRVKVASVKNFQLCERNAQDHIMQFGRIEGRHAFTMDFQHPLTPMQAFAIAISSLQSKISFG